MARPPMQANGFFQWQTNVSAGNTCSGLEPNDDSDANVDSSIGFSNDDTWWDYTFKWPTTQDPRGDTVEDSNGKKFPAYMQPIDGWVGLQITTAHSAARLANVKDTLDDDMISDLLKLFPSEEPATHLVMNKEARNTLRKSRTATNPTGAPAPQPEEVFGTPIIETSSLRNTEAIVA